MSFTPSEHRAMLERADLAIDRRDRVRTVRVRTALVTVLTLAACAAAISWWPRTVGESAARGSASQIVDSNSTSSPSIEPEQFVRAPLPPPPSWLEIIDSDEEIEACFAEAGECTHVIRVDHKIVTVACSELSGIPTILPTE